MDSAASKSCFSLVFEKHILLFVTLFDKKKCGREFETKQNKDFITVLFLKYKQYGIFILCVLKCLYMFVSYKYRTRTPNGIHLFVCL